MTTKKEGKSSQKGHHPGNDDQKRGEKQSKRSSSRE
jgi:hypothetical protein